MTSRPILVMAARILAAGVLWMQSAALTSAASAQDVSIPAPQAAKGDLTGKLLRPAGAGQFPAVVALHGCGGLLTKSGAVAARESDWAERLVAAGYVVLLADSFTARGLRQICTVDDDDRTISPRNRADDARAAAEWLGQQAYVDKARIALMGWSHGAMTVLWTVRPDFLGTPPIFKVAIALYPGCRAVLKLKNWRPSVPLSLLIGADDDWTEPTPCRQLAEREGFRFVAYPGAYHGFDAPNSPVRVRKNLGAVRGGQAHVGTNPAAREAAIAEIMSTLATTLAASR